MIPHVLPFVARQGFEEPLWVFRTARTIHVVIPGGKDDTRGYSGRQGRYTWLFRAARTISAFRLRLSPLTLVPSILLMRLCQSSCFNCSRSSPTMGLRSRFGISHVWPFVAHLGFEEPSVVSIRPQSISHSVVAQKIY